MHARRGYTLAGLLQFIALVALILGWIMAFKPLLYDRSTVVHALAVSPNGKYIAAVFHNGTARVWDADTRIAIAMVTLDFKPDWFSPPVRCAISDDTLRLATTNSHRLAIWDVNSGKLSSEETNSGGKQGRSPWITPSTMRFVAINDNGSVSVLNHAPPRGWKAMKTSITPASPYVVGFSCDERQLVTVDTSNNIVISDIERGTTVWSTPPTWSAPPPKLSVSNFALSPDAETLAVCTRELVPGDRPEWIWLWRRNSDALPKRIISEDYVWDCETAFSADGINIGLTSSNGIQVHDVSTKERVTTLGSGNMWHLVSSADGKRWVTADTFNVRIWNSTALKETGRIRIGFDDRVIGVLLAATIGWFVMVVWRWRRRAQQGRSPQSQSVATMQTSAKHSP